MNNTNLTILQGDAIARLRELPDNSVHCVVTSPPYYGLRNYKVDGQIGLEETPQQYVDKMVEVCREIKRVLRKDGILWLNLGDSYAANRTYQVESAKGGPKHEPGQTVGGRAWTVPSGLKPKDLLMIPERVAMALQADGWYLRAKCPWLKRNSMPESVKDRPATTIESIFMLTKSPTYFYDALAVKTVSKNAGKTVQLGDKSFSKGQAAGSGVEASGNGRKDTYTVLPTRSRRSSDWFFESWQGMLQDEEGDSLAFVVNTKPYRAAHFATFPKDLVEPMIKAGTSEKGCCSKCGAPYERILEKTAEIDMSAKGSRFDVGKTGKRDGGDRTQEGERFVTKSVGWRATCECQGSEIIPCTTLDPFGGSGTTGAVALELGRKAILIELNPDYIPLIRERCGLSK